MSHPLVSVITPVYNGALYLRECIESVLAQTYDPLEYIIVDNCSTDDTLAIAHQYQRTDKRIRVVSNSHFVGAIENHNIAFRCISDDSKYCKAVSADDWLYPECITKMVELAECNPTVGIVQAYAINIDGVRWPGLPHHITVFDGRDVCRLYLLGKIDFTGMPSSVLYRSSLVMARHSFFPGSAPSADAAAYLQCLQGSDLGFVHQILSFERIHERSMSAKARELDSYLVDRLELLLEYGPIYLTREEFRTRLEERLRHYYGVLAVGAVNVRPRGFWNYHQQRLEALGYSLYGLRLGKAVCLKVLDLFLNPKQTVEKVLRRLEAG
jgi:glycosyltransferase involved in cell wall biosynthesis